MIRRSSSPARPAGWAARSCGRDRRGRTWRSSPRSTRAHAGDGVRRRARRARRVPRDLAAAHRRDRARRAGGLHAPDAWSRPTSRTALAAGVDCVVGTTGLPDGALAELAAAAPEGTCLFVAPNFAIGAVLMMRFAAAGRALHAARRDHRAAPRPKADAPSGTALRTASLIAEARASVPPAPGRETEIAEGARGALVDDVTVHSVRLPGPRRAPGGALRRAGPDAHRSATTPSTARASCPASCSPSARSAGAPGSSSASRT